MNVENPAGLFKSLTESGFYSVAVLIVIIVLLIAIFFFIRNLIEKKKEMHRRIEAMSNMDDLTHLYKRKFFDTLVESELERAKRHDRNISCAIIEIDDINKIREKYGDQFCESVVEDIGEIFTDDTRVHDICARYGKYSFASLMPESDIESALFASKRLMGLIQRCKFELEGTNETIDVTVSVGLVSCKEYFKGDIDKDRMLDMADIALDIAKEKGGNRVECYTDENS